MKVKLEVEVEEIVEQILKQLAESGDVIQVVRCKDCKLRRTEDCLLWDEDFPEYDIVDDEFFCADAVRR